MCLKNGAYNVYTGGCVRCAKLSGSFEVKEDTVTRTCVQACAPVTKFDRMVNHNNTIAFEPAPQREYDMAARSAAALKPAKPYTGDKGIKLGDVFDGKAELEDFVAQLSDKDLICLMRGEGHELSGRSRRAPQARSAASQKTSSTSVFPQPAVQTALRHSYGLRHRRVQPAERHLACLHL